MRFLSTLAALGAALTLAQASVATAGELDNEASVTNKAQLGKDLPATLVVRVNNKTKAVEVLHTNQKLSKSATSKAQMAKAEFVAMGLQDKMHASELDRDSSSSSWYFCFPNYNWYQPSYYYSGYQYSYSNYWSYNYGGYSYNYYSNPYWGGYGGGYGGFGGGYGGWGY